MLLLCLFLALPVLAVADSDWTRFRGPNGSGVTQASNLPTKFGAGVNMLWKTAVPFGHSSPVILNNRIFLTAAENGFLVTLAYDAATGKQLWRKELKPERVHKIYRLNGQASPTPAVDNQGVYVFFGDFGLLSYTHDGRERWRHPLGPFDNFYGLSSSPVVANGAVHIVCDQARGSFLLAVDAKSGKRKWLSERKQHLDGWGVPIVHKDQIIVFGSSRVDSYFLDTGELNWWIPISSEGAMGSPVIHGDTLIVTTQGSDQPLLPEFATALTQYDKDADGRISHVEFQANKDWTEHFTWLDSNRDHHVDKPEWDFVRTYGNGDYGVAAIPLGNGKGRLDRAIVKWRFKRNIPYVPSTVVYDDVFYMVKNGGIITSLDPTDGKLFKQGRADGALGEYFASPVAASGKIFLTSEQGKITVLKAGPQWEVLAVNDMQEECYATPAISGNRLYVRTRGNLYAFAEAPAAASR